MVLFSRELVLVLFLVLALLVLATRLSQIRLHFKTVQFCSLEKIPKHFRAVG